MFELYEFSLSKSVVTAISDMCRRSGWKSIRRIVIKAGGMRRVNPELMAFSFSAAAKGTPVEDAKFTIMTMPIIFRCGACGRTAYSETPEFMCPLCGSRDVELLSGLDIAIDLMEVETQ